MADGIIEQRSVVADRGLAKAAKAPLGFVILLGTLSAFGSVSIDMYLPALPSIAKSLHASEAPAQITVAAYILGLAFGQLFYGPISDRYGRRKPLLFGIGLYIVGTLGCILAPTIHVMIAFRVIQALGGCAGQVIGRAIVRDSFAHDEVLHVLSMLVLVFGITPVLAPLLGGWLLLVASWRWLFGFQLLFAVIIGTISALTLKESRSATAAALARSENPFRSYLSLLGNRQLSGYLLTGAFSGAALFTYISTSPDVIIGMYHFSPQQFGWVFAVNAAGYVASNQMNARLARRYPSDTILKWANRIIFGVSLVMVFNATTGIGGALGILAPMFLIMSGFGFNQSNAMAGALNVDPRRAGTTASLQGAAGLLAGSICATATGLMRDGTPRPMSWVIAASLLAAMVALRTLVFAKRGVDAAPPQPGNAIS
ncbi:DHA1 family bicyclomycin/chloramphenicol resistance-like MFS transporter [Sphingomonas vulcanisoli]|uniref:Bcr/CflA family efflux transporter n=1 Tax=Sphingomonas vulcanisoli TaxID=1658060 RepID=A0ABX0TW25_9SPHN|nr:multidrug effflux MFS transporter [Sphingomonas vulcanisoli]NIJ09243.1 DHA1 family bicyclomycin/chloramphenicol resistance-like MFS transporter [Sphingomonas vulcanisoli]